MQVRVFDGERQDNDIAVGGTNANQVEGNTIVVIISDEKRGKISVRAEMVIAGLIRIRGIACHHI